MGEAQWRGRAPAILSDDECGAGALSVVLPDALALDLHRLCGGVEYRPISSLLARSWLPRSPSNPERPDAVSLGLGQASKLLHKRPKVTSYAASAHA